MLRGTARLITRIGLPRSGSALYPTVKALSVAQFQHQQYAGQQAANWTALALALLSSTILLQSADCTNEGNAAAAKRSALGLTLVADVVEAISPAVVNIISESSNNGFFAGASGGSGFIIRRDGFIVTNAHVIANGDADQIIVTMKSTRRRRAVVHALDTLSDLAVLRLLDVEDEVLPVAPLGRSAKVRAGEFVIAIGSPMLLQNSASFGIVSATARHASELGISNNRSEYIQTDAAVNTGNSGGPLVNLDGEVIGINTLKVKGADGISLAIPIDVAEKIVKQLIENKRVIRPFVGLKMQDMISPDEYSTNRKYRSAHQYPTSTEPRKVVVLGVVKDSPADRCGLTSGDEIVGINGREVRTVRDVLDEIGLEVGKPLNLTLRRHGKDFQVSLVTAPETLKRG